MASICVLLVSSMAVAAPNTATPAVTGDETSFARAFFVSEGSYFGTAIIWFLMLLSILSLGLIVFLWLNNRRINVVPPGVVSEVRRLIRNGEYRELIGLTESELSYFSGIMTAAFKEASHGFTAMLRALDQAAEEMTMRRLRQIEILNVLGNVAPMIGLFGTVYGMILTFQTIVSAGGRPDPVELAGGIGTALTTTFWGLVVAIPSLAGYAMIRNHIDALTGEASAIAEGIVNEFRPGHESGDVGAFDDEEDETE